MTPEVIFVEELPHPLARVWMAITDPAQLADWLMPNDFEPRVGKRFTLRCPPGPGTRGWVDCTLLELEAPRPSSAGDLRPGGAPSSAICVLCWQQH